MPSRTGPTPATAPSAVAHCLPTISLPGAATRSAAAQSFRHDPRHATSAEDPTKPYRVSTFTWAAVPSVGEVVALMISMIFMYSVEMELSM